MIGTNRTNSPYTDEHRVFILSYKTSNLNYTELRKIFNERFGMNVSKPAFYILCKRLGFEQRTKSPIPFTKEQKEYIFANYKGKTENDLLNELNAKFNETFTLHKLQDFKKRNKLHSGLSGKWKKGNVPWTKTISKEEWFSHYDLEEWREIHRVKSEKLRKYKNVGDIFKSADGFLFIITSIEYGIPWHKRIRPYAQYIWEQHNGKIPNGYKVTYKDGNKLNCDISNLILVSKKEILYLAKNNGFGKGEITETLLDIYQTKQKIKEIKNGNK